eukprot:CAMPEP_0115051778 /NCGR_PEP_ID=MMETSP0227-20121206/2540_1 /TAXON_ID=89957 /ORGANISM="Polarella glacialis, Strain CCMP 1383" /LENGTH=111 /DNA_ID=CAMNT_0002435805 /DNA_START=37 /DNA_END=370 /DNA_ORIENTATION=-
MPAMDISSTQLCFRRQAACSAASRFALEVGDGAGLDLRGIGNRKTYQKPLETLQHIFAARKEASLGVEWIGKRPIEDPLSRSPIPKRLCLRCGFERSRGLFRSIGGELLRR